LADLVALARAEPGKLNWAGTTGAIDFLVAGFWRTAGLNLSKVPYRNQVEAAAEGDGEVETLLREFGRMTEKLKRYRRSSLGELLEATESAQAAIDSLIDPVLAFNEDGSFRRANEAAKHVLALDPNKPDPLASLAADVRAGIERVRDNVRKGLGPQTAR